MPASPQSQEETAAFWRAVRPALRGDAEELSELIEQEPRLPAWSIHGRTLLMEAARGGQSDGVRLLLPLSDPLAADTNGYTALILAVESGANPDAALACVRLLAPKSDVSAKFDEPNSATNTAMLVAIEKNDVKMVEAMLPWWAPASDTGEKQAAMWMAVEKKRWPIADLLASEGQAPTEMATLAWDLAASRACRGGRRKWRRKS